MSRPGWYSILIFLLFFGCREEDKVADEIGRTEVRLAPERFDLEFAKADSSTIGQLKLKYPYLFPKQYPDSVWITKMRDTIQIELLEELSRSFAEFQPQQEELERCFQHILYYFPETNVPKLVTLPTDVDYHNRVILTDTLLLIGLDNYLGGDHRFYEGIDRYITDGMDRKFIVSDVAEAFAKKKVAYPQDRTFLARMIYYGKILYLKDKLIPFKSEAIRIGYTEEDLEWAQTNEEPIWRYMVERDVLYSTDAKLGPRFLDPAPFSKFQLELDNESPGRIGRYVGWQIVRAFMDSGEFTLPQLIDEPAESIFKKSRYKPKK